MSVPVDSGADPADRGTLTIDDRVVERVAAYAAARVEHTAAAPRRVLGLNVGSARPQDEPSVTASVYGNTAVVRANVAVAWPQPIRAVADDVRRQVREEVERITGVRVDLVDVEVASLQVPAQLVPRVR